MVWALTIVLAGAPLLTARQRNTAIGAGGGLAGAALIGGPGATLGGLVATYRRADWASTQKTTDRG